MIEFDCQKPEVDEEPVQKSDLTVKEKAEKLAVLKAQAVFQKNPTSVVLGGDQMACLGEQILNKAGCVERACEQLKMLQGQTHELVTSMALISAEGTQIHTNITRLTMRALSDEEILEYVEKDQPLDCAGSYKIEESGISLFEKIECEDFTAIEGLPLMQLSSWLRDFNR